MTVTLNKFSISDGFGFFASQAAHAANRLTEFTFHLLDGTTTSLGRLLPELRPTSVGDAVLQAKKTGSALFETPDGDVLIEITQDKCGRYTFVATGESLEPVIFVEGKKRMSGAVWEVKVSTYLQGIVSSSSRVAYGVCAIRWRGEKFADLKEKYSAEGLLRKKGDEVLLKLPEEPMMSFRGPQSSLKAEIVLKHFYQRRKTPMEEAQSKHWDSLNRLFVGYLYFSGFALAPWVNDHVLLPHQRAQMEEDKAQRMAADGYLDEHELKEMAQHLTLRQRVMSMAEAQADGGDAKLLSQLDVVTFQQDGYSQTYKYDGKTYEDSHVFLSDKEVHSRTVCPKNGFCEEFVTEKGPENLIYTQKRHGDDKIEVQKATFKKEGDEWKLIKEEKYEEGRVLRLSDRSFASTILDHSKQLVANTATVYFATFITGQNAKIALISSLFQLISQTKAAPATKVLQINAARSDLKSSILRRTPPITLVNPLPNLNVEPGAQLAYNINLQSQYLLSNPNQNLELSIQQANGQPAPAWISMNMGAILPLSTLYLGMQAAVSVYVSGNYAYVPCGSGGLNIVDISNLNNPVLAGSHAAFNAQSVVVKGNYAYLMNATQLEVLNVATPSSPTLITALSVFDKTPALLYAQDDYLYSLTYNATSILVKILSISNPENPTQISSLSMSGNYMGSIYVSGNYVFVGSANNCYFIDVSVKSNPVIVNTISSVRICYSFAVKGNYLFMGTDSGLNIYDITTISNPVLIKTVYVFNGLTFITLEGNYIYGSSYSYYNTNYMIIDIGNILNSKIISSVFTYGTVYNTFISNNNVILANGGAGLSIFNAGSRVLSGIPSISDRGLLFLNVTAQDDLSNTVENPLAIHVGNINVTRPIPNNQVYVGNSTLFTLDEATFEYPNANFTYSAGLVGGLPLPSCVNFDPGTRTFLFSPRSGDQNTYRIQVFGDDGYGAIASTTFDLNVPDRPPVLAQPLGNQIAYTGVPFEYIVASNAFTDADGDELVYSANLVGSSAMPGWLTFDPALRKFFGTPFGRNTYQMQINANDERGGVASDSFTITVPSSEPVLLNPVGTQLASTETPFSFVLNSNTFYSVDGDPLTYSTNALPPFLFFNNATRTFTGTPQIQDTGTYSITIYAENPFGAVTPSTFSLSVISSLNVIPPVLVRAIPDFSITSDIPFNITFSSQTFEDPQNNTLTYTATLEGGAPLPPGLYFSANNLTLSGVVPAPQILRITIKATNSYGAFAIDTLTLTVLDGTKYPPVALNPLPDASATVGVPFFMKVPENTFKDLNGDPLTITVIQAGGLPLPDWLKWEEKTLSFSGTPGPHDTDTYSVRQVTIDVWATDSVGSVKTSFIVSVGGESFWATFIKYGISFVSIGGTGLGLWKSRALIWNYLCKDKYQKKTERALVGQHYSHPIQLKRTDVKELTCFLNGKPLSLLKPLPDGLIYKANTIQGTPLAEGIGRFTMQVFDHKGYIHEEFELIIKNNENDPDPEKHSGYLEKGKRQLSSLCTASLSKKERDEDEEEGRFGKTENPLLSSQEMANLNDN